MKRPECPVPLEKLDGAIEEMLKTTPCTAAEMMAATGRSARTVRRLLEQMEHESRAYRTRIRLDTSPTVFYLWHHGPAPHDIGACAPVAQTQRRATVPFQTTVRVFPAINRRDPLVAALFGPAPRRV